MSPAHLADLIVAVHVAYVAFIVGGQGLILLGGPLGWGWVRNLWFRLIHFFAISLVALEAVVGMACPLTVWEDALRRTAGEDVAEGTFIGRLLHDLIFYSWAEWVFTTLYIAFALFVLATFWLVPPRRGCDLPANRRQAMAG